MQTFGMLVRFLTIALCAAGTVAIAQTTAPLVPTVTVDTDGTLHWGPRIIPPPAMASPELRQLFAESVKRALTPRPPVADPVAERTQMLQDFLNGTGRFGEAKQAALKVYPVNVEETVIGGVKVSIYTPKDIAPRNKNRIVMEFEIDPEAIILAAVGKMKVMSVHFSPFPPKGTADIVAVYRELLKTHKPSQIAMFGLSGGCQMAANTTIYMASQKLPMPGALGLFTCAGGSMPGDTRVTMNGGLDPFLSDFARTGSIGGRTQGSPRAAAKPGDPPQEILLADIPKGFPPSYLVTGTRDMCLSHMAVLHRKLRAAGVEADLNVFEGAWHGATADPTLPEARDAQTDFFHFLDKHLGT